jgi:lysophospholipase L1-like esterase
MTSCIAAFGDSFSCGEGVGTTLDPRWTWVSVLARSMGYDVTVYARPGTSTREVAAQVRAASKGAEIATLLVGLNDVVRADFEADRVRQVFARLVAELAAKHRTVLVARWHDPVGLRPVPVPMPAQLGARIAARMAQVNDAVSAAAALHGALVLDLAAIAELRDRAAWAVDRVHPSRYGQHAIAAAAGDVLREAGYDVRLEPAQLPNPIRRIDEARWLVAHGAPWLVKRLRRVALPVAALAVRPGGGTAVAAGEPAQSRLLSGPDEFGGQRAVTGTSG